jgi:hypothetical protein
VLDVAAAKYGKHISWVEVQAGEKAFNETGHLTTAGKSWSHTPLKQWLEAPTIAGVRSHRAGNGKVAVETTGTWEPILGPGEREALLTRLGALQRGRPTPNTPRLLNGPIFCGRCGSAMYAKRGAGGGGLCRRKRR